MVLELEEKAFPSPKELNKKLTIKLQGGFEMIFFSSRLHAVISSVNVGNQCVGKILGYCYCSLFSLNILSSDLSCTQEN